MSSLSPSITMLFDAFRARFLFTTFCFLSLYRIGVAKFVFDTVVGFGDSCTDTGKVYNLTNGTWPIVPPYYKGRFANGPTWIELLGIPNIDNYAYGGSTTDDDLVRGYTASGTQIVPGARQQIRMYLNQTKPNDRQYGRTLYAIWSGNNDYFFNPNLNPSDVANRLGILVQDLIAMGGKHVLIMNKIPGQYLPYLTSVDERNSARERAMRHNGNLSLAINSLKTKHPDVSIYVFDIYSLMVGIVENNTLDLANKTGNCWTVKTNEIVVSCSNPDSYLFVDQYHVSARVHQFIGDQVRRFISNAGINPRPISILAIFISSLILSDLHNSF